MQHPDVQDATQAHKLPNTEVAPSDVVSDQALPPVLTPDERPDAPDDSPDEIFLRAVSEIDTQPLPRSREEELASRRFAIFCMLFFISFFAGSVLAALAYPTVTVIIVPVERNITLTVPITIPLGHLAPVTLAQSLSTPTSGRGHQDARVATGTLTFYNGEFIPQTIAAGAVLTGNDGTRIATDEAVTVPAANPPYLGQANVLARAVESGRSGNIRALDINARCCFPDMLVKNILPFTGGQDARDYQAVAAADISTLTGRLRESLNQQMPRAFSVRPGETLWLTGCTFKFSPNHQVGEEAQSLTVQGAETCQGLAYNTGEASRKALAAFTALAHPGPSYEMLGALQTTVVSVTPFLARCHATWVYHLTGDDERSLAAHIAGDSPRKATVYLLRTGFIRRAAVTANLPRDPDYIHFRVMVEGPG